MSSSTEKRKFPADFLLDRLLYRDGLMLVVDKPAGLTVHAGPAGGESLEDYFDALRFGLPRAPALAHRLDRDTSGCLILGRHPKALRKLGKLFQEHKIEKVYWAVCNGVPAKLAGTIDSPLRKVADGKKWRMAIVDRKTPGALAAKTTYRVTARRGEICLIEAKPKTGRTHQIRVHLASIGAPILGDPAYGDAAGQDHAGAMMLHARRVVAPISKNRDPVVVEAPPPAEMRAMLDRLGVDAGATENPVS